MTSADIEKQAAFVVEARRIAVAAVQAEFR